MKNRTHKRLNTPVIGKAANLNSYILNLRGKIKNSMRYTYVDPLLQKCYRLFECAMRQLEGKNYLKRSIEVCEEIQAYVYLITALNGFTEKECAYIDIQVDEILDNIVRLAKSSESSHGA